MQNLKNLRLHNYPFGDGDWRAADQFEENDPKRETISELEQISKLSLYQSKGKSSSRLWVPNWPSARWYGGLHFSTESRMNPLSNYFMY